MRKIILITITILTMISTYLSISIKATDTKAETEEWFFDMENYYTIKVTSPEEEYVKIHKMIYKPESEPVFCLHPLRAAEADAGYRETDIRYTTVLNKEQSLTFAKIVTAYKMLEVDYATNWHTTKTYAAASYLIYESLRYDVNDDIPYEFDNDDPNSDYHLIADDVKKLKDIVASLDFKTIGPSFKIQDKTYNVGEVITLTDTNGVLNEKDYKVTSYSTGIENISIGDKTITFTISDDDPLDKHITIEPIKEVDLYDAYFGVIYGTGGWFQSIYKYKEQLPFNYSGAKIALKVNEDIGKLKIKKIDEEGNTIKNDVIFSVYKAEKDDEGNHMMGDVVIEEFIVNGETEIDLLPGYYYLKEIASDHHYIIDDSPILIEIKRNETTSIEHVNRTRDVSVKITKKDSANTHYINDTLFTIYKIGGDEEIFIGKKDTAIDLDKLVGLREDELVIVETNEDYEFKNGIFVAEENMHTLLFKVKRSDVSEISLVLDGFDTYIQKEGEVIMPFEDIKVLDNDQDITSKLVYLGMSRGKLKYRLDLNDDIYIILRNHLTRKISEPQIEPRKDDYVIYKCTDQYDLYITNKESDLITDAVEIFKVEQIDSGYTSNEGNLNFSGLKDNSEYLICEVTPSEGYEFGEQAPCVLVDPKKVGPENYENITFVNKIKDVYIEMYKTNSSKNILLNGAEFDVYKVKGTLDSQVMIDNEFDDTKQYLGHYISGYLHLHIDEFGVSDGGKYRVEVYKDAKLISKMMIDEELNIGGLEEGEYTVKLRNMQNDELLDKTLDRSVKKGTVIIDDLKYDEKVIIKETKAPVGYQVKDDEFTISFTPNVIEGKLAYYRINEMIIIPPDKPLKERKKYHIVPTSTKECSKRSSSA